MKKTLAILTVAILMIALLTGCGKGREFLNTADLTNYIDICDYENIVIDTSSEDYNEIYVYFMNDDIRQTQISEEKIKDTISFDASAEAVVEYGDMVNIDYIGYIGETAFENGSDTEALLLIGSGSFIDNFEEQLIGGKPGQTVDVHVTFPSNYSESSLANTRAKFVVKINSIAKEPEQLYKAYQLDSQEEYVEILNVRSERQFILEYLLKNSKVNNYPEDDIDILYDAIVEQYELENGIDLTTQNKEDVLNNLVYPYMKQYMNMYYIFDEQELMLLDSTLESQETTNPVIAECYAVYNTVMNYLLDNATIK